MGNCAYCGKPAGFLKKVHIECRAKHFNGTTEIKSLVKAAGITGGGFEVLDQAIKETAEASLVSDDDVNAMIVSGWEEAVQSAFDDGILTEAEETNLSDLRKHFSLTQQDLDGNGAFMRMIKGGVLREILEGKVSQRISDLDGLPFNLQKSEQLIWAFQDVAYLEEQTKTHYQGGSQGVSIRVAQGVYYRVGGFKAERVQTAETVHVDTGLLGVTNKHIYFAGSAASFRINFNKIVSFQPFSDVIGVHRDARSAKPQTFVTGDGWFTYNMITNLAQQ